MDSPVEDFDVVNVIPLFFGLTDISLVTPILVVVGLMGIFVAVYYYLVSEPALSDSSSGFLISGGSEYFSELKDEDYYLGLRIAPVMGMIGQIVVCGITILTVSNGAEAPISLLLLMFPLSLIFGVVFVFIMLGLSDKFFFTSFEPAVPSWLLPLLILVEISSFVIRLFSLAIRISANFTSGHILFFTLLTAFGAAYQFFSFGGFVFLWPVLVAIELLESAVVFIQTQVFLSLLMVYASEALGASVFIFDYFDREVSV